jgi:hypothetical protein
MVVKALRLSIMPLADAHPEDWATWEITLDGIGGSRRLALVAHQTDAEDIVKALYFAYQAGVV